MPRFFYPDRDEPDATGNLREGWQRPKPRSLREAVWALLCEEHVCMPPDETSIWVEAASSDAKRGPGVYACPECGKCWLATGPARTR